MQPVENRGRFPFDGSEEEAREAFMAELTKTFGEDNFRILYFAEDQDELDFEYPEPVSKTLN